MKKHLFLLAMLVLLLASGLVFVSCPTESGGGSGGGKLTITNIPAADNNKFMAGTGNIGVKNLRFAAEAGEANNATTYQGVKITNGSVTLNVFILDPGSGSATYSGYTGSESLPTLSISTSTTETVTFGTSLKMSKKAITFDGGSVTIDYTEYFQ